MALATGDKVITLTNIYPVLGQIKKDIEAASASGGGSSSSSEDLDLVRARLTKIEMIMNDMHVNPFGDYEYMDEIIQPELESNLDLTGTQFVADYQANTEQFLDNMEGDLFELYIIRNAADPIGYARYNTLLPYEGSTTKTQYGKELEKVCKYNQWSTWNWNWDEDHTLMLSAATDSAYVFRLLKRPGNVTKS